MLLHRDEEVFTAYVSLKEKPVYNLRMKHLERYSLWVALFLPIFIAMGFNLFPRPGELEQALSQARYYEQSGNPGLAYTQFLRAANQNPHRSDLWELAGQAAWKAGMTDQAIAAFQSAQKFGEISSQSWLDLGDAFRQKGDLPSAVSTWSQLLQSSSTNREVFERLEAALQTQREWKSLLAIYQRHLELEPQNASVAFRLAEIASIYDPTSAQQWANRSVAIDPSYSSRVNTLLAGLLLGDKQTDAAYRWTLLGRTLGNLDAWDLAMEAFQLAINANPSYGEAWAFLGEAYQQVGQDGTQALDRAENLAPESLLVQALQAMRLRRAGQPEAALVYLQSAAKQEPNNAIWKIELGNTLAQLGKLPEALSNFQAAVTLNPQDAQSYRNLAAFCIQYNYQIQEDGLVAARQAVLMEPDNPASADLLGQIFLRLGDFVNAERYFLHATELSPAFGPGMLHLGILYMQQGKPDLAKINFTKVIELQPGSAEAEQAERLLRLNFPD